MADAHKIDHEMKEHNGHTFVGNGAELSRQVTVQLSPEQYERLFFQPSAPRRGDLAKRFGMSSPNMQVSVGTLKAHSQPNAPRPDWFPDPVHIDYPHPLRVPRCSCASKSDRT